jgi:hypothetical protein
MIHRAAIGIAYQQEGIALGHGTNSLPPNLQESLGVLDLWIGVGGQQCESGAAEKAECVVPSGLILLAAVKVDDWTLSEACNGLSGSAGVIQALAGRLELFHQMANHGEQAVA